MNLATLTPNELTYLCKAIQFTKEKAQRLMHPYNDTIVMAIRVSDNLVKKSRSIMEALSTSYIKMPLTK